VIGRSFFIRLWDDSNARRVSLQRRSHEEYELTTEPFDVVKHQISYCGLWCGSCVVGNGTLKELTTRYEHIVKGYGVAAWGAKDFDGKEFLNGLVSIRELRTCRGCLNGDGNLECKIRPCAMNRKIPGCNECNESNTCKHQDDLQNVRKGARQAGMMITTDNDKEDRQQLIERWTAEIKNTFPNRIIDIQT
jgi:hypothetical protein